MIKKREQGHFKTSFPFSYQYEGLNVEFYLQFNF